MAKKLFPPEIQGTLPAFTGTTIVVPFAMNKAVSMSEVGEMILKIKTVQNDIFVATLKSTDIVNIAGNYYEVTFNSGDKVNFQKGSSYRFQLAYIDIAGAEGYYSSVGVAKYTTKPEVIIEDLITNEFNYIKSDYYGVYRQYELDENNKNIKDQTEKVYSYTYSLFDKNKELIETSGEKLFNSINDIVPYESITDYKFLTELESNEPYFVQYTINTMNNLTISTPKYKIIDFDSVDSDIKSNLCARNDYENGYIELYFDDIDQNNISGLFELSRKTENTGWEKIYVFLLNGVKAQTWSYKDFTVEQGVKYTYSIRQYSEQTSIYSSRILLSKVYNIATDVLDNQDYILSDFEDMFLYDGERQLRIKYNPKVSSFKTTILESKNDTLGGKYPTFFRNGVTEYKDFPINGLLSYWDDDEQLFVDHKSLGIENDTNKRINYEISSQPFDPNAIYYIKYNNRYQPIELTRDTYVFNTYYVKKTSKIDLKNLKTTNLVNYNIKAERQFKLLVLDWLNNGKAKLFKSPNEGNYLVRLMNCSLTPEDGLGRMLHNFSCTAYEIGECNNINLTKNNINNLSLNKEDNTKIGIESYDIVVAEDNNYYFVDSQGKINNELVGNFSYIEFSDCLPGTSFYINKDKFTIGTTGTFHLDLTNDEKIITLNQELIPTISYVLPFELATEAFYIPGKQYYIKTIDEETGLEKYELFEEFTDYDSIRRLYKPNVYYSKKNFNSNLKYYCYSEEDNTYVEDVFITANDYYTAEYDKYYITLDFNGNYTHYGQIIVGKRITGEEVFNRYESINIVSVPNRQFVGSNLSAEYILDDKVYTNNHIYDLIQVLTNKCANVLEQYGCIDENSNTYTLDSTEARRHAEIATKNYLSQFLFSSEEFSFYYYIDGVKYQSRGKIKGTQCKGRLDIINPNFVDYSKSIENCVNKIIKIYKTRFIKRDIEPLYYTGTSIQFNDLKPSELEFTPGEFFKDYNLTESVLSLYDLNPWCLYEIRSANSTIESWAPGLGEPENTFILGKDYYIDRKLNVYYPITGSYLDIYNDTIFYGLDNTVTIGDNEIDLTDSYMFSTEAIDKADFDAIKIGNGIIADLTYVVKEIVYNNELCLGLYNKWKEAEDQLQQGEVYSQYVNACYNNYVQACYDYLDDLQATIGITL